VVADAMLFADRNGSLAVHANLMMTACQPMRQVGIYKQRAISILVINRLTFHWSPIPMWTLAFARNRYDSMASTSVYTGNTCSISVSATPKRLFARGMQVKCLYEFVLSEAMYRSSP
jgi:hypothetical protein